MSILLTPSPFIRRTKSSGAGLDKSQQLLYGLIGVMGPEGSTFVEHARRRVLTVGGAQSQNAYGVGRKIAGATGVYTPTSKPWSDWEITTGAYTYACMVEISTYGGTNLLAGYSSGSSGYGIGQRYSDGTIAGMAGGSAFFSPAGTGYWRLNKPQVAVVTYNGAGTAQLFLDGKYLAQTTGLGGTTYDSFCRPFLGGSAVAGSLVGTAYWGAFWNRVLSPGEILELAERPQVFWIPRQAPIFNVPAATGTTIAVPAGSLTLTGFAPQLPTTVAVPAGTLALSGFAPQFPSVVDVPLGTLALSGFAPQLPTTVVVPLGTLALTGFEPQLPTIVDVPLGTLTLSGNPPTLPTTLAVPAGALTLTALIPTIQNGSQTIIDVPLAALTLSAQVPDILGNTTIVEAPLGTLALLAFAPTIITSGGTPPAESWPGWVGGSGGGQSGVDLDELEVFKKLEEAVAAGETLENALANLDAPEVAPVEVPRKLPAKSRRRSADPEVLRWLRGRIVQLEEQIQLAVQRQSERDEEEVLFLMQHLL